MCSHYLFLYLLTTPKTRTFLYQSDHDNVLLAGAAFRSAGERLCCSVEQCISPPRGPAWGEQQASPTQGGLRSPPAPAAHRCPQLPTLPTAAHSAPSGPLCRHAHAWGSAALSCLLRTESCQPTRGGDGRAPAPVL